MVIKKDMKDKYLYVILVMAVFSIVNGVLAYMNFSKNLKDDHIADSGKMVEVRNVLPENKDKEVVRKNRTTEKAMMRVSAFSSIEGCDDKDCIMANGKKAEIGYVACSRKYKLGTKMRIEGKTYVCGDRLSMKYDSRVDMFTGWGQEGYVRARQWGVRSLEVEIIN